jgi:hypothetical protein
MGKRKERGFKSVEFILAIAVAFFLIGSLLSKDYLSLPSEFISFLILLFVLVKLFDITKNGGTIFEDYISIAIIIVFGVLYFFLQENINSIVIVVAVFVLVYSVGLIPWINDLVKSEKIISFILSYAFFVVMVVFLFAGAYYANNAGFNYLGKETKLSFEDSLYFSTISFTTVGYGDISPTGSNRLVASIQSVLGMILNIGFIGYILASKRFRRS